MNALVLMMGGSGTRYGDSRPKQYTLIHGIPLFAYIIRKINTVSYIDRVIIVSHEDWLDYVNFWCETFLTNIPYDVVHGGDSRSESVLFGLNELSKYASDRDIVLFHDATHPYVDVEGMQEVIEAVKSYGGATLSNKNYDTVYQQDDNGLLDQVLQRENVIDGASPEAFFFGDIYPIYKNATPDELNAMTSAGAIALAHHIPMKVVPSRGLNLKITYPEDMDLFMKLCDSYFFNADEVLLNGKMETVKAFDRLCKDNGLEYFMTGDMLIGCIRYKTMEPGKAKNQWRIGMLRDQFDKLLEILPKKSNQYGLWNNRKSLGSSTSMLSIGKHIKLPEGNQSLDYDIFIIPFDTMPEENQKEQYLNGAKRRNNFLNKLYVAKGSKNTYKLFINRFEKKIYPHLSSIKRYQELVKWAGQYHNLPESQDREYRCVVSYQSYAIPEDQLFPLVDREFCGMMLPSPKDYSIWIAPEVSDEAILDGKVEVVKAFDRLCKDNGLEYFLTGDILIGCMHYHTAVPNGAKHQWRIGMLRDQYDKFLSLLPDQSEKYGLNNNLNLLGEKTSMLSVGREIELAGENFTHNYNIFIIPFDELPEEEDSQKYYLSGAKRRNNLLNKIYVVKGGKNTYKLSINRLEKIIYRHLSSTRRYQKLVKEAKKYQNRSESKDRGFRCVVSYQSYPIQEEQLFPLVDREFCGVMLPCPKDCSYWTTVITPEIMERTQKIQQEDLVIIKEFDRVCRKIGVKYFLCGGTLLGSVRDHGFIPWDDDVDVGMLRKDYDRFLQECEKYLDQDKFFLQTRESDPEIPYLFSKIRANHTEYITEYNERRDFHKGICLDIFPFDVLPDEQSIRDKFVEKVLKLSYRHNYIVNLRTPEPEYDHKPRDFSAAWNRIRGKISRAFWKSFSLKKTQQKYLNCATKYNDREMTPETTVASFVPDYTYIELNQLLPVKDINFEGLTVMTMNNPEDFLTRQYGDYMQYPPEHKRMGHDLIRWSVDTREQEKKQGN